MTAAQRLYERLGFVRVGEWTTYDKEGKGYKVTRMVSDGPIMPSCPRLILAYTIRSASFITRINFYQLGTIGPHLP